MRISGAFSGRAVHVVFSLTEGRLLYRDIRTLGCLWLVPSEGPTGIKGYDNLGPDAISPPLRQKDYTVF